VGVLAAYIGAVRCGLAPPLELGPLLDVRCVATLPPEAAAADVGAAVKKPDTAADGAADGVDEGVTEWVSIGDEWTLLSLLYGRRRVAIPPRCPSSIPRRSYAPAAASKADAAPRHGLSTGLVLTADGQQPKYARAAFVALHTVRRLQRSSLPVEVFHIGPAEAFEPAARSRLAALGDVAVIDLLERLPQRLRAAASTRLRSFAAKPFALLVASFEVVLLLVIPGVDESDVVLQRVGAVEEVLQYQLVQLFGQEEALPAVLLRLQVLVGRGLSHPLAL
jgi:hypothetical protein